MVHRGVRPQSDNPKVQFLQEFCVIREACTGPWVVGSDFNLIYRAEDKNNNNLDRAMMGRFRRTLNDLQLKELPLLGRKYTWSIERNAPTLVLLDRVFYTADWETIFPDCILQSPASLISDCCPLILGLHYFIQGKRRFHFEKFWPKLDGYLDIFFEGGYLDTAAGSWNQPMEGACTLQLFANKLKRISHHLQSWSQKKVGHMK